jgi:thymidylate synthase ThyX
MVELRLYSYGPAARVNVAEKVVEVGPDVFIAVEGVGTFEGVALEKRLAKLYSEGRDAVKMAARTHRESTRRGHASLTTSMQIMMEVSDCSRALSMLLVAPPFGSYLQESQRRARIDTGYVVTPRPLAEDRRYGSAVEKAVQTYFKLLDGGVELEDARYILPLCTKTSLFISCSLENYVAFMQLRRTSGLEEFLPAEVGEFAEKFEGLARSLAPLMVEARLGFGNRLATYPYPNPYKPRDVLMERLVRKNGYPDEPIMLSVYTALDGLPELGDLLFSQNKETYDSLNPLITAHTLEPMSLVAYHQAIRHRTIPTSVESVYTAAERALGKPEENIVIPPSIRKEERLKSMFLEAAMRSLHTYESLVDEGYRRSDAVLVLPQALRLYVARLYNGFNLLHPSGFLATRTCSYAQWEERGIAYKIMYELLKKAPSISHAVGEKCRHLGFCPEKSWCPVILKYHRYDDELHKRFAGSG